MSRNLGWQSFIDEKGDFELPSYLYSVNNDLMKHALDLGTLLSEDSMKLRAYKEQIKKIFKKRWLEMAQALEFFDLVTPCVCSVGEYCEICGGSRYRLNSSLTPDQMQEIGTFYAAGQDVDLIEKLQIGLRKAIAEVNALPSL